MASVEVAIDKLREAGADLRGMGDKLGDGKDVADGLELTAQELAYLGDIWGVTTEYEKVRSYVVGLLRDGDAAMNEVGDALVESADSYEQDEEAGLHDTEQIDA